MFVVFSNMREVIITTKEDEARTVESFFTWGGRELDNYDRKETADCGVRIRTDLVVG